MASDSYSSVFQRTEILIPLCRGVKSNATRNALQTKPTISCGSVNDQRRNSYIGRQEPVLVQRAAGSEEAQQLQQQIAQMQQQMNALLQGGAPQAPQALQAQAPRPTRAAFVNTTAIQKSDGSNPRRLVEGTRLVGDLPALEPARLLIQHGERAGPNGFVLDLPTTTCVTFQRQDLDSRGYPRTSGTPYGYSGTFRQ